MKHLAITFLVAASLGCAPQLRAAAQDHAVITRTVVESCKVNGDKCTHDDLEAVAKQAECIAAITEGRSCE